jgi:hypothetical protein
VGIIISKSPILGATSIGTLTLQKFNRGKPFISQMEGLEWTVSKRLS